MREVVIVSACRTPVGDFAGSLSAVSATDLGALVIKEAVKRAGVENKDVDEVIMGSVLPHGLGQNPARQSMVRAGLPWEVGAITVNKVCGSGLKAVMLAAQAVGCGGGRWAGKYEPLSLYAAKSQDRIPHEQQQDGGRHGS